MGMALPPVECMSYTEHHVPTLPMLETQFTVKVLLSVRTGFWMIQFPFLKVLAFKI
jgi:hypothetical protein